MKNKKLIQYILLTILFFVSYIIFKGFFIGLKYVDFNTLSLGKLFSLLLIIIGILVWSVYLFYKIIKMGLEVISIEVKGMIKW